MHSCGFDSIPSDIGVHALHPRIGGTIDSIVHQLDVVTRDRALRKVAASLYSLSPARAGGAIRA